MVPTDLEIDRSIFTYSFVRTRSHEIHCDWRTYTRELHAPGSVRGAVGVRIRLDIDAQRQVHGRAFLARADARGDTGTSRERY